MKVKIFEALKTKYSNLGFSKEVLEGVAAQLSSFVTEESQVATSVDGAESMLKSFQSFADGRVGAFKSESEKAKAEAEALKARLAELEKGNEPKPSEPTQVPDYMKSVLDSIQELKQTVAGQQAEKASETLKQEFAKVMADKKVPESFYKANLIGRKFEDNSQIEEFASAVSSSYEVHLQELTNQGFEQTRPPEGGKGAPEKESEAIAELINKGTEAIVANKN